MQQEESTPRKRKRKNYIEEWRLYRGLTPGDILRVTGAGKELAWRWRTKNNFPTEEYLSSLLDLLQTERECLFAPPPGGPGEGKGGPFYSAPPVDRKARTISIMEMIQAMSDEDLREFVSLARDRLKSRSPSETQTPNPHPKAGPESR
jgi:hypothetical protein